MITDSAPREFACSACSSSIRVDATVVSAPMHPCAGRGGMTVPFAPAGESSKVELVERQDYVGVEDVQRDDEGRVWMSAVTTTDQGEAVAVYAPCAHGNLG